MAKHTPEDLERHRATLMGKDKEELIEIIINLSDATDNCPRCKMLMDRNTKLREGNKKLQEIYTNAVNNRDKEIDKLKKQINFIRSQKPKQKPRILVLKESGSSS